MVLVTGQLLLLAVLVLILNLLVAVLPRRGFDARFETAGFACVEIALLASIAKVVSPVVVVVVLPVLVLVTVVPVVPVLPVPEPVPEVPVGARQFTLVAPTVQLVLKFERLFNVLLTQPDTLVAAINRARLKNTRMRTVPHYPSSLKMAGLF
ncbi:MAG: hypothetical protein ABJA10_02230 [Aestuariivirga sp.]